jgi:hypothetical protein
MKEQLRALVETGKTVNERCWNDYLRRQTLS